MTNVNQPVPPEVWEESARLQQLASALEKAWRGLGRPHPGTGGAQMWRCLAAVIIALEPLPHLLRREALEEAAKVAKNIGGRCPGDEIAEAILALIPNNGEGGRHD